MARNGKPPERVQFTHIYGPIGLEDAEETFPTTQVPAREVARVAAELGRLPAISIRVGTALEGSGRHVWSFRPGARSDNIFRLALLAAAPALYPPLLCFQLTGNLRMDCSITTLDAGLTLQT